MEKDLSGAEEYWVPECARAYLRAAGYSTRALEDMEPHVHEWDSWMRAVGEFYDYRDTDGFGRVYQVHRRTIMPAMRVCREWGSLLLDEKTVVACESRECTDWLGSFFSSTNFWGGRRRPWFAHSAWAQARSPCGWTWGGAWCAYGTTTRGWWCRSCGTRRE